MAEMFSDEDKRILDKTINVRERIIDHLIKGDLPTKSTDVLAITAMLESMDNTILKKAKLKIEDTVSKTSEETKEALKELLMGLHRKAGETINGNVETPRRELPADVSFEFNPHELSIKIDTITIDDFNEVNN